MKIPTGSTLVWEQCGSQVSLEGSQVSRTHFTPKPGKSKNLPDTDKLQKYTATHSGTVYLHDSGDVALVIVHGRTGN
eukprot:SAG31_NODE_13361_length_874_cov_1.863226_2_plen_76_part_01